MYNIMIYTYILYSIQYCMVCTQNMAFLCPPNNYLYVWCFLKLGNTYILRRVLVCFRSPRGWGEGFAGFLVGWARAGATRSLNLNNSLYTSCFVLYVLVLCFLHRSIDDFICVQLWDPYSL